VGRRGRSSSRRKVYSKQEEEEDPERRKRKVYSGANTVNEEEEGEVGSVHGALQTCLSDPYTRRTLIAIMHCRCRRRMWRRRR